MIETPVGAPAASESPMPGNEGDCDNPCRTSPYRPLTAQDAQLAALFKAVETAKWRGNADELARLLAPEFAMVTRGGVVARDRLLTEVRTAGKRGSPGDPVTLMRIHGFEGAAIMVSRQQPFRGGKSYVAVRLWVQRDGRFQMSAEQRTVMEAAAPTPAVVRR